MCLVVLNHYQKFCMRPCSISGQGCARFGMRQATAGMNGGGGFVIPVAGWGSRRARVFLLHRCGGVCHGNDMDHTLGLSLPMSAACPPRDPRFATTLAHGLALLE